MTIKYGYLFQTIIGIDRVIGCRSKRNVVHWFWVVDALTSTMPPNSSHAIRLYEEGVGITGMKRSIATTSPNGLAPLPPPISTSSNKRCLEEDNFFECEEGTERKRRRAEVVVDATTSSQANNPRPPERM